MKRDKLIHIGLLIHDVARLHRTAFNHHMKPFKTTRSQWWVLSGISRHGAEGITQTNLADVLDLGEVALGGLIDRLEERGFVERRTDTSDRRINRVFLTRKGGAVLEQTAILGMNMDAKVMKGVSLMHQHMLAKMLYTMKSNLIAMDAVPGAKANRRRNWKVHRRPATE